MDEKYFAKKIEQKWQRKWAETGAFDVEVGGEKPKFYQLEMLPYPSGNLHMGHVRNYSAGDALAWYKRLGISYDWRRHMFAHRPEYYKWDQLFFLKMYEMDLAYKRVTRVNWCPH